MVIVFITDLTGDVPMDSEELQPFPTLQQCLELVPPEVGFNIEIKHPLENTVRKQKKGAFQTILCIYHYGW